MLQAIPVIFAVITLTFFLSQVAPGDPVDTILGVTASFDEKQALRAELGLDQPLLSQYTNYLFNVFRLDLGQSYVSKKSVAASLIERFPATFELTLASMILASIIGIGLTALSFLSGLKILRPPVFVYGLLGVALPAVVLGPTLVWIFAIQLDLLPVSEKAGLSSYVLPALSLAIPLGAVISRITQASMQETLGEPFIRSLRAKGLSEFMIQLKHTLTKSLVPVVTVMGLQTGALLTGTVITETIFDWPGIGRLLFESLTSRDFPVIGGCVLFIALLYVLVNLLTDIICAWLNPHYKDELLSEA